MAISPLAAALLRRGALLLLVWYALAGGESGSWWFGLPTIALALAASLALAPPRRMRLSPLGLLRFVPYFLARSFLGGLDVARRAFSRPVDLRPGVVRYQVRLAGEGPRVLFANLISLLPGTLATRLDEDRLRVHVLDESQPIAAELATLEARIAGLYGQRLAAGGA